MVRSLIFTLLLMGYQNGQDYYQQALVQERAAGNLEAAIQLYQDAARYAGNDRALAAQALMGAARCQEKLGQAKARETYEEIARTYGDQQQLAAQARDRAHALEQRNGAGIADREAEFAKIVDKIKSVYQVGPGMYWSRDPAFDTSKPIKLMGTVSSVQWVNPAISISVQVTGPDGKAVTYVVKGGAPNTLLLAGFSPQTLKLGDTVTIEGFRAKEPDSLVIRGATLTWPDGRKVALGQSVSGK